MPENEIFTFDSPKGQSSYIKVIGVGGGGNNAVNHMYRQGIDGVDFIVCNTDIKALNASPVPNKLPLGNGLGAGHKPEKARMAAQANADAIREAISHNTQMLFITAGMGGGTGTGASPVIAEIAKSIDLDNEENKKILVVAIVTRPFGFEGSRIREQANAGIEELRKHVDSIIIINNDKLFTDGKCGISQSFSKADDVLLTAAKGIAEIITRNAYVNRDFQDINTVMENSGTALMGTGSGRGENRAEDAIVAATTSVLLDDSDIRGAKNVLMYFTYSSEHEITMEEMQIISDYVLDKTDGTADITWGAGPDETLDDELKVILIATGFETSDKQEQPNVTTYREDETPKKGTKKEPVQEQSNEPTLIHREPQPSEVRPEEKQPIAHTEEKPVATASQVAPVQQPKEEPAADSKKHIIVFTDDEDDEVEAPVHEVSNAIEQRPAAQPVRDVMVDDMHLVQPEGRPAFRPEAVAVKTVPEPVAVRTEMVSEAVAVRPEPSFNHVDVRPEPKYVPMHEEPRTAGDVMTNVLKNDNDALTAAERIRRIHELLRNNTNGADIVQGMRRSVDADPLYQGQHSGAREASTLLMRADGSMVSAPYLHKQTD